MTRDGVTFNELDPSGTRISRSSEFSVIGVFRDQQHRNGAKYTAQSAYFMKQKTTDN